MADERLVTPSRRGLPKGRQWRPWWVDALRLQHKLVSALLLITLSVRTFCRKRRSRLEGDLAVTFW